jgi:hypothetical protein
MAAATAMGDCNGDGDGNGDSDSEGNSNGDGNNNGYGNGNGNRVSDGNRVSNGDGNGNVNGNSHSKGNHYKGRVASSCDGNVQHFGRGNTLPLPPWTQGKCIHQRCIMRGTLLRVFAPLQRGGFLTAHHGLFLVYFLQLLLVY